MPFDLPYAVPEIVLRIIVLVHASKVARVNLEIHFRIRFVVLLRADHCRQLSDVSEI